MGPKSTQFFYKTQSSSTELILGSNEITKTTSSYQNCRFINIVNQAIFKVCNLPFVHHFISSLEALKQNRCRIASASRSPKDPMLTPGKQNSRVPINRHAWKLALVEKRTYAERNWGTVLGRSSSLDILGIQAKKPTRSNNIN